METKKTMVLRIYISSSDKIGNDLLYEHIIYKAKERGMAGATVLKGIMGFGASTVVYSVKMWEVTEKLPVIVELIDEAEKTKEFLPVLRDIIAGSGKGCLITSQELEVELYMPGRRNK